MKIRFLQVTELEVVESYDEELDRAVTTTDVFPPADEHDVDLERRGSETTSFQFGDGSMAYNVPNELFEIISMDDYEQEFVAEEDDSLTKEST